MAKDFELELEGIIHTDSNASIGIVHRTDLGGTCRHINIQYLWIQGNIKDGELGIQKVLGTDNPADLFTKGLAHNLAEKTSGVPWL